MIVYREDVEKFRSMNRGSLADRKAAKMDPTKAQALSFASGNTFESLAKTNPEEFNLKKLKALKNSENLVRDFNLYYQGINDEINRKANSASEKYTAVTKGDAQAAGYMFNTTVFASLIADARALTSQLGDFNADVFSTINKMYLPEALTEEGCKKLIDLRIKNNKLLTDSLVKMLKNNYQALNITSAEAASLIEGLENDETNNQAIGKIKDFLLDPKKLEKFRMGKYNYDFRPIGGGCIFLSQDPSIQFSQHPSKNLARIFKYDAIVCGHGGYSENSSSSTAKSIKAGNSKNLKEFHDAIEEMKSAIDEIQSKRLNDRKEFEKEYSEEFGTKSKKNLDAMYAKETARMKKELTNLDNLMNKFWASNPKLTLTKLKAVAALLTQYQNQFINTEDEEKIKIFAKAYNSLIKIQNQAKAEIDPKQAIKDGTSTDWTVQPISTLKTSNNTRMIDVIRALKKEGFKNIFIGACNPGNVQLPADIRNDKNFKVSMGSSSVYLESTDADDQTIADLEILEATFDSYIEDNRYRRMSIDELFTEYDYLNMVIYESVGSAIKAIVSKAIQIIAAIWKRIVEFFRNIYGRIKEFISSKFGDKSKTKTKKPVEVWVISMNGDKAKFDKKTCNSPEEIMNLIQSGNATISAYIKDRSAKENDYIKKLQDLVNSGKLKKDQPKAQPQQQTEKHESSIFDGVIMI